MECGISTTGKRQSVLEDYGMKDKFPTLSNASPTELGLGC
jgi:hypothetical protein